MRYSLENNINPMSLVDERYFLKKQNNPLEWNPNMKNIQKLSSLLPNYIGVNFIPKKDFTKSFTFFDNEIDEESLRIQALSHPVKNMNEKKSVMERYNQIMAEAKEVARLASNSEEKTNDLIQTLKNKWKEINQENSDSDDEITEAKGVKIGRPKLRRYKSFTEKNTKAKIIKKQSYCNVCSILGFNYHHPQNHCRYSQMLFEIAKKNSVGKKGNKCRICNGTGHKSTECINLKILREKIEKQKEEEEDFGENDIDQRE